jgi:DNA-binding SARP family transcriptional activator
MQPGRAPGLFRARLVHLLNEPAVRIGIVIAPAGSGKSTLLSQFAQQCGAVAAHRMHPGDAVPGGLLRSLLSALGTEPPKHDASAKHSPNDVFGLLVSAIEQRSVNERMFVILDDVHLVQNTPAEQDLEKLVRELPRNVTLVLSGRHLPRVDLSAYRMAGEVAELLADDLRFRSWEVHDLFATVYGIHLAPADNAHLAHAVDGWAAGLQLFRLATARKTDRERRTTIDTLGRARVSSIRDFLTRHIVEELPSDLRFFLTHTSVLGVLSQTMCRELLADVIPDVTHRVEGWLSEVVGTQIFVSFDLRGSLHLHDVLRSHLESLLADELDAEQLRNHYLLAAKTLEAHGHIGEAARALLCANANGQALALLRSDEILSEANGREPQWARYLPRALSAEDAHLQLLTAQRLVRSGQLREAADTYALLCAKDLPVRLADRAKYEFDELRRWNDVDFDPQHHQVLESRWSLLRQAVNVPELPNVLLGNTNALFFDDALSNTTLSNRVLSDKRTSQTIVFLCVQQLLRGDLDAVADLLNDVDETSDDTSTALLIIVRSLFDWLKFGIDPSAALAALRDRTDHDGLTMVCRVVRAILLAFPLPHDPPSNELAAPILREAALGGDPWSSALAHLFLGLGFVLETNNAISKAEAKEHLTNALFSFVSLRADVLGSWAASALACIDDSSNDPMVALSKQENLNQCPIGRVGFLARSSTVRLNFRALLRRAQRDWDSSDSADSRDESSNTFLETVHDDGLARRHGFSQGVAMRLDDQLSDEPNHYQGSQQNDQQSSESVDSSNDEASTLDFVAEPDHEISPAGITISLFGGLKIHDSGEICALTMLKPRALSVLRFLCLRGAEGVSADEILETLWPNVAPEVGAKSLHVAISQIRRGVKSLEDLVRRCNDRYVLQGPHASDARQFREAIRDAELASQRGDVATASRRANDAIALYRGPLLPEDDNEVFAVERDRLQLVHARACELSAMASQQQGDYSQAERAARLGLLSDRFSDPLWQLLISCCESRGAVAEAARTKRDYHAVLSELGVTPA